MKHLLLDKETRYIRLSIIGTLLFVLYYLADCALDSLLFGEESFTEQLLNPSGHEVAIRILSGLFLFTLFIAASCLINKNRSLQRDLQKKKQELYVRNQELETYHAALSNELGTSLERITVAKEVLNKKCARCSDTICRELIEQIDRNSTKLANQIDNMLSFSELNRTRVDRRPVAIDNIAREIAKEIAANTKGETLDIQIDNRLEADCDPEMIYVALKNLIDNAVRYRSPERSGQIEIGASKQDGAPVYYIRDNGIGFKQEDCEHLFHPFEKQANNRHHCRNGVGLATAKIIIERHGGAIWAESCPEEGTTIYFTLQGARAFQPSLN